MIVHPASLPVLPEPSIFLKAVDRPGIRIPFVEVLDFRCYPSGMVNAGFLVGSSMTTRPLHRTVSASARVRVRIRFNVPNPNAG